MNTQTIENPQNPNQLILNNIIKVKDVYPRNKYI